MTEPVIQYRLDNDPAPIAHLTLNRLAKKNALRREDWVSIRDAVVRAEQEHARVLIIRSAGSVFCAGADIEELHRHILDREWMLANHAQVQAASQTLAQAKMLTIAVIEGACVGGGVGLAGACDLRYGTHGCSFQLTPAKLGLSYSVADMTRIIDLIGIARAREMLLSASSLPAIQALTFGLLHELHAINTLDAALDKKIAEVCALSAHSIAALKVNFLQIQQGHRGDDSASQMRFAELFAGDDFKARASAFLAKN